MGSNRTQKPICLLAEPLVSDSVAVQHKIVLRTSGRSCGKQSSRSTGREARCLRSVGSNPPKSKHSSRSASERILPGTRFLSSRRDSVKPFMASGDISVLLTLKVFSVCKDFFMASMRPRLLVELSQA